MPTLEQLLFYCLAAAVYCTLRVAARVLVCVRSLAIQDMILIFDDLPVAGGGGVVREVERLEARALRSLLEPGPVCLRARARA